MNIAIIGGGNIGTLLAAQFSLKLSGSGVDSVRVYTSRPGDWQSRIEVLDIDNQHLYTSEKIDLYTSDLEAVLKDADMVFVTVPPFMFQSMSDAMKPYICPGMEVCIVPGNGGAEFYFQAVQEKGGVLCVFERVHAIARLLEYGKSIRQISLKKSIRVAVMPNPYMTTADFARQIETLLPIIRCMPLPNVLCASLAPSNPIMHTSRLYRLFMDYDGTGYPEEKFMYDTWDDGTSELVFSMDDELQCICRRLDRLDLTAVPSLKDYYENQTISGFTQKMRSIPAFQNSKVPMVCKGDVWHPDFSSRFFRADIEYSLQFMHEVGRCCGVNTPTMDKILDWYRNNIWGGGICCLTLDGLTTEQLYAFYEGP